MAMGPQTVFVTGGTGFLGSFLIDFLLKKGNRVVALVRGPEPTRRLCEVLHAVSEDGEAVRALGERLLVVEGDVRERGLGLSEDVQRELAQEVTELWHCATSFKFQACYRDEIAAHNITGTHNLLRFAQRCNTRKTASVFYVSTAYAAPTVDGVSREALSLPGASYRNLYEWSKQEAEHLVWRFRHEQHLPAVILRPSVIVGHSRTGCAVRFSGYYDVIRTIYLLTHSLEVNLGPRFDRNLRTRILAQPQVQLNVVPVDFVVEAMWRIARAECQDPFIFHLVHDTPTPLAELFHRACEPLAVEGIELVGEEAFRQRPMTSLERIFNRKTQFQAPYLLESPRFDQTNFRTLVPAVALRCPPIDRALLQRVNEYYYREVLDRQFGRHSSQPLSGAPVGAAAWSVAVTGQGRYASPAPRYLDGGAVALQRAGGDRNHVDL